MSHKQPRVSVVIPVYNEAAALPACLDALAAQTVPPLEVIVVDNNSSDDSVAVAARYPFVKVLHEPRQGVVYARSCGFDAVRGEIIGRIDADTEVPPDWIASLQKQFAANSELIALMGRMRYGYGALGAVVNWFDHFWRGRMSRLLTPAVPLQGANMALRKSDWEKVKPHLCQGPGHEDMDLSFHLSKLGQTAYLPEVRALIACRQAYGSFGQFVRYAKQTPADYRRHKVPGSWHMYEVVAFIILTYPIIALLARGADPRTHRFSLRQLFKGQRQKRVNPATFVD